MSAVPVLALEGIEVRYGKAQAVRDVKLSVTAGRLTTLIGSNGAGKTTILKAVAGLLKPAAGSIQFYGEDIRGLKVEDIVGRGISVVPEGRRLFSTMSVEENLRIGAYLRKDQAAIEDDFQGVMEYFPDLRAKLKVSVESLSGGQQQMVAVGRALMSAPRLLLLDEPTIGLAPNLVRLIGSIIKSICGNGVDILLVEQNASMALELADDAYVLENGAVTAQGKAADLLNNDDVRRAYLGV
ncbi:MAG TPA: ABC transporter ATP-binding protein [Candidimonas sp.]|nr:ABC transporter ATP-binding protein [Candidimonas sp.]